MSLRRLRRIVLFYLMAFFGLITTVTGLILYFWVKGPKAGSVEVLGYTKEFWKDLHTYVTVVTIAIVILHVIENRRIVKLYIKETLRGS